MTSLRSGLKVNLAKQRKSRRHRASPKLERQPKKKTTRKTKPTVNAVARQSAVGSQDANPDSPSPNVRHRRRARGNQLGAVDIPAVLRDKRRWVQRELEAGRISGKSARELHDLYNKNNIGNVVLQRRLADNLTEAAREAKLRLEESFELGSGAAPVAGAVDQSLGDRSNIAGIEDPTTGQTIAEAPRDNAADLAAQDDLNPEDDPETEDESSSEEEDLVSHANQTRALPTNTAESNDAAARQVLLGLGIPLADYAGQDIQMRLGDSDGVVIKREEEGSE